MSQLRPVVLLLTGVISLWSGVAVLASVTEVSVAKGHQLTGVRHTLSLRNKRATRHEVTGQCIAAPTEADRARLSVGACSHIGNGVYTFTLSAHPLASDGDYVVQFIDKTTKKALTGGGRNLPRNLTVHVKDIVVLTVGFRDGGSQSLGIKGAQEPNDYLVQSPEWWNGVRNHPAAYVRDSGQIQIKVKLNGPPNYTCNVDATGTFGGIQSKAIRFDGNGEYTSSDFTTVNDVPTVVARIGDAFWQWRVTKGGQAESINGTSHELYFTYANNSGSHWYSQLYYFGCVWASGQSTAVGVSSALWAQIATRAATGYAYRRPPNNIVDTRGLLLYSNGQCGAWGRFYRDLHRAQGIPCNSIMVMPPSYPAGGLRVPAQLRGQGGGPDDNQYVDHCINRYGNQYFDPSYGTGAFPELVNWEDASIEAFFDPTQGAWYPDPKGYLDVAQQVLP